MTTIAYRDGIIVADSQSTMNGRIIKSPPKIHVRGNIACATSGSTRVSNIFQFETLPEPTEFKPPNFDMGKWMHNTFVPWFRKKQIEIGFENDEAVLAKNMYLVCVEGIMFELDAAFTVRQVEDFCAIGGGSSYALGAMAAGSSAKDAVEIASKYDTGTSGKLQIVDMRQSKISK